MVGEITKNKPLTVIREWRMRIIHRRKQKMKRSSSVLN